MLRGTQEAKTGPQTAALGSHDSHPDVSTTPIQNHCKKCFMCLYNALLRANIPPPLIPFDKSLAHI